MIERITSHFDWVFQLPIESQCHFAVGVSFVGFVFAAFIRETCKKSLVRFGARAIGAASFFAVAAFANFVSHEYEKLNTELMVRRGSHDVEQTDAVATQIANPVRVVAVASEYSTTIAGQTVSLTKYSDGRIGSVSFTARRESAEWDRIGGSARQFAAEGGARHGSHDGADAMRNGKHAVTF